MGLWLLQSFSLEQFLQRIELELLLVLLVLNEA
jgi:hypothetical protein